MKHTILLLLSLSMPLFAVEVSLTPTSRGTIHRWVTIPSTLQANQSTTLHARVAGHVKSISADIGDFVKKGQTLAVLEVPEIEADMIRARTEKEVAATTYQRLLAASEKAAGLVIPQDLDEAEGRVKIAEAAYQRQEVLLAYATMTAPFDGVITARHADVGAFIPLGGTGRAGATLTIADLSVLRAEIPVPEVEARFMKLGTLARIMTVPTEKPWQGTISRNSQSINPHAATMLVEVDVPNEAGKWINGAYVKIQLAAETHNDALVVPVSAVLTEKISSSVFLLRNGKAVKTPVTIGFNDGQQIEVLTGLKGDESLIVLTGLTLADGQAVTAKP
jgi:membrane fusion protein, multidrug efflux system